MDPGVGLFAAGVTLGDDVSSEARPKGIYHWPPC